MLVFYGTHMHAYIFYLKYRFYPFFYFIILNSRKKMHAIVTGVLYVDFI